MEQIKANSTILIIDDDSCLSKIVSDVLTDYGYKVSIVDDGDKAYQYLENNICHLIILDINLPKQDGFTICKELRQISTVPIIFVSARTSETDRITGLDIGADDYIAKPYSLKELLSRVNSLMRRTYGFGNVSKSYTLKDQFNNEIYISSAERKVLRNNKEISLSLKEFDLLMYLAEHMNEAVKKDELLKGVWGTLSLVEMSTLTVHIRWLREKLEKNPSIPCFIKTVWGIGYMLCDCYEENI